MSATNNITNNTFNILVIPPHQPTGTHPVDSNSSAPTSESPWENDKLILPCKTTRLPEQTDAPVSSEETSYFRALIPKTVWGKLLGLTTLGITATLCTLGLMKLSEDIGLTEGIRLTHTLGPETSWELYQKMGFKRTVEVVQASGLDVPKALIKYLGWKETALLVQKLGLERSLEALK